MGFRELLLPIRLLCRNTVVGPGADASCQPLQPTCCHEYPPDRPPLERQAFALPTDAFRLELPSTLACRAPLSTVHADVE